MISGSDTDLVQMIGAIYDAVIDQNLWWDALDHVRRRFGFHIVALAVTGFPRGNAIVQVAVNIPDDFLAPLASYNNDVIDLWGGPARMAALPLEEPVLNSRVTGPEVWEENRFYLEWARPLGLVDQIGIILVRAPMMLGSLGLGRHESAPPLTEDDMDGLRVLAPHLRRAVTISGMLDVSANATTTFQAALEATSSGVVLVDTDMSILYANGPAAAMLEAGDPVFSIGGRLALRHELEPGQLQAAVQAASEDEARLGRRGIGIPTRRRDGTPLSMNVMPLERRPARTTGSAATAAVFIADAGAPIEMPADAMRLLYDLTPAEQRVFELVVAGVGTGEIAQTLRVFEKTGRHSRAELIRLSSEIRLPG